MVEGLRFQWDSSNVSHIARHAVVPKEVEQALLNDPYDLSYETVEEEERWTSIGHTDSLRVLLVVWTIREGEAGEVVRVITAREATRTARTEYLRAKGFAL